MTTLTTPIYKLPWPDGAERVMDGDNAIGALATAVEGVLSTLVQPIGFSQCGATLTLGTTDVVLSGTSVAFTPTVLETVFVLAIFDFDIQTAPVTALGSIYLDGAGRTGQAIHSPSTASRACVCQGTVFSAPAGPHTVDLRARKTLASGVAVAQAQSSRIFIARFRTAGQLLARFGDVIADADIVSPT